MEICFILIHVSTLRESEVLNKLSKIPEIIELHACFGKYDIIAKIEAKDFESIGKILLHKIRTIDGILYTSTLPGLKFH